MKEIALCDDDPLFSESLRKFLNAHFKITWFRSGKELLFKLQNKSFDLILLDIQMETKTEGLDIVPKIKDLCPDTKIAILTGHLNFDFLQRSIRLKVDDYLPKGYSTSRIKSRIDSLLRIESGSNLKPIHVLSGTSKKVKKTLERLNRAKGSNLDVWILGETGTGKERIANALKVSGRPWVTCNAPAIPESMAESLFFGHEKGAFTGALQTQKGLFEQANGGTLFIDEISKLSLTNQQKILRAIQERTFRRLGGHKDISVNFRLISASNDDLRDLCEEGKFLWDLYFRICVIPIELPPLRLRKEDISVLIQEFVDEFSLKFRFTKSALESLELYHWPGNVRELKHLIQCLSAFFPKSKKIDICDLPKHLQIRITDAVLPSKDPSQNSLEYRMNAFEKQTLLKSFQDQLGNVRTMAQKLGVDRSNLYKKLKFHGILKPKNHTKTKEFAQES